MGSNLRYRSVDHEPKKPSLRAWGRVCCIQMLINQWLSCRIVDGAGSSRRYRNVWHTQNILNTRVIFSIGAWGHTEEKASCGRDRLIHCHGTFMGKGKIASKNTFQFGALEKHLPICFVCFVCSVYIQANPRHSSIQRESTGPHVSHAA